MKKWYSLTIFLSLQLSILVQGQTIDPDSEWRDDYSRVDIGGGWTTYYKHDYKDFIDGDTVLNSLLYHKIYHSGYYYQQILGGPGTYIYYEHNLQGFLREENDKWYMNYNNQDTLLYDFTLETGDTLKSIAGIGCYYDIIVYDVDSIIVDGDYKKRLALGYGGGTNDAYLIEGIGSTTGLFVPIYQFEWAEELVCYARNGISLWGLPTEQCNLAVKINEKDVNLISFSILPNPAKDFTTLIIPSGIGKASFIIRDLIGRIIYQGSFESPSTNKIQLTSYHSGIYLAVIESIGFRQTIKLILE